MSCLYLCTSQIFNPYDPLSIWYGFASTPKSWIIKVPWNVHADIFNIIQRCHHTLHLSAPLPGHTKALYGTVCKVPRWSSWSSNHRCQHGDTPPGAQTATARRRTSVRVPPRMSHHWALGQAGMVWVKFCRALRTRRTKRWVKRVKPSIPDHHYRQLVCSSCLCFLAAVFFALWSEHSQQGPRALNSLCLIHGLKAMYIASRLGCTAVRCSQICPVISDQRSLVHLPWMFCSTML